LTIVSILGNVEGLDVALGLRRAMANNSLYVAMLRRFLENRRGIAGEIRSAIALGDIRKAELLSHTLRGISGQVGATTVATNAENLEKVLNGNSDRELIDSLLAILESSLTKLFLSLEQRLAELEP
jgi:adenylate cyclase